MNNAVYLELFEEARWDLVTRNGYGYEEVLQRRLGPAVLEANLIFKRELRNRQRVRILSWLESYEQRIGKMAQKIVGEGDTLTSVAVRYYNDPAQVSLLMRANRDRIMGPDRVPVGTVTRLVAR